MIFEVRKILRTRLSLLSKNENLIGHWALVSYESILASGDRVCMKEGQIGSLEYLDNGFMRVVIDRDPAQLQALGLSPRLAHLHYSGRYEIDIQSSLVYHHVEEADHADRVGKTLIRHFRVVGKQLEISGVGLESGVKLVWEKSV